LETIRIIERREKDIDALRNLFFKTRLTTSSFADTSQYNLSDFDKATEDEYIFIALLDESLIGFISVWVADNFIHHLYVEEKFQNQRVGTLLLNNVLHKFGYPVRLKCEESNTKALRFYKQRGFIEKEKGRSEIGTYILLELNRKAE
jgi:GNAT superfamily N-acetyltransferase